MVYTRPLSSAASLHFAPTQRDSLLSFVRIAHGSFSPSNSFRVRVPASLAFPPLARYPFAFVVRAMLPGIEGK